jgi:hypothetical protein
LTLKLKAWRWPAAVCLAAALAAPALAQDERSRPSAPPGADLQPGAPRLFVISDVGNEPDDQMSFVRLLLYSNEIDIEGLVAATSVWQRDKVQPQTFREIVAAYGQVRGNLLKHAAGWPTAETLAGKISAGQATYGMAAVGPGKATDGSRALIAAADRDDPRALWISLWGGANTLAQALFDVRATRSPQDLNAFVAKLRVVSISDQDDAGSWIRREFPNLSYVVQPSSQDAADYGAATWTGISGDVYYRNAEGADGTSVTNAWLDANVRAKGPLGAHYPRFAFIMEGDTPAFLNLVGNGLEGWRSPSWGGWGGRYLWRQPHGETHPIWTQGGDAFARITSQDEVVGVDGKTHVSNQATIWRWRSAYQNDFAARMDWTIKPFSAANHAPTVVMNGKAGSEPILVETQVGQTVMLDAVGSSDPDGDKLRYAWFNYREAGFSPGMNIAQVALSGQDGPKATITGKAACAPQWLPVPAPCIGGVTHVILAVTDGGSPALTTYRRVIVKVAP